MSSSLSRMFEFVKKKTQCLSVGCQGRGLRFDAGCVGAVLLAAVVLPVGPAITGAGGDRNTSAPRPRTNKWTSKGTPRRHKAGPRTAQRHTDPVQQVPAPGPLEMVVPGSPATGRRVRPGLRSAGVVVLVIHWPRSRCSALLSGRGELHPRIPVVAIARNPEHGDEHPPLGRVSGGRRTGRTRRRAPGPGCQEGCLQDQERPPRDE